MGYPPQGRGAIINDDSEDSSGVWSAKKVKEVTDKKVSSDPPKGKHKTTNTFVDPATGRLVIEFDDGT